MSFSGAYRLNAQNKGKINNGFIEINENLKNI